MKRAGAVLAQGVLQPELGESGGLPGTRRNRLGSYTCDRGEFVGRSRTLSNPAALFRPQLAARTGAGLDPCGALQVALEIEPGRSRRFAFVLGCGRDKNGGGSIWPHGIRRLHSAEAALEEAERQWSETLGAVQVQTPDDSFDLIVNRWLRYQTLSVPHLGAERALPVRRRIWLPRSVAGRLALLYARPDICRRICSMPRPGSSSRGTCSTGGIRRAGRSGRVFRRFALAPVRRRHYVAPTGDGPCSRGRTLPRSARSSPTRRSLHAASGLDRERVPLRALPSGHRSRDEIGAHGLPLIGSGDWNDGMNRVGHEGRGESVWLGWFLVSVLERVRADCERAAGHDLAQQLP